MATRQVFACEHGCLGQCPQCGTVPRLPDVTGQSVDPHGAMDVGETDSAPGEGRALPED